MYAHVNFNFSTQNSFKFLQLFFFKTKNRNKMIKKVVTLGEIMLRLSMPDHKRIVQSETFDATYGGAEANVAVAMCNYGLQGSFITKVPDNSVGQSAINHLRRFGVDTQFMIRGGNRLGIYFLEPGASLRASQVLYDRAGSSITEFNIDEFDIDAALEGADWFHTSGITPALSDQAAALTEAVLKAAQAKGITTSIDINYRKKLWTKEKAAEVLGRICQHVDVCIGADTTLGIFPKESDKIDGRITVEGFKEIFKQLKEKFGFRFISTSLRESHSASDNSISALVYDGADFHITKKYDVRIVDRVGTGDSFASGLIYGLVTGMSAQDAAEFAVAASVIKHTIPGDFNHASLNEVLDLMKGEGSVRVQR